MEPYTTDFLIDKLYTELNNNLSANKSLTLERLDISCANKKTAISNFRSICAKLNREEYEVKTYFEKELLATITINSDGCLIITGMFKQPGIYKVLNNYIKEFVTCKECNSCDTKIIKENRVMFMVCNRCLSKKALS